MRKYALVYSLVAMVIALASITCTHLAQSTDARPVEMTSALPVAKVIQENLDSWRFKPIQPISGAYSSASKAPEVAFQRTDCYARGGNSKLKGKARLPSRCPAHAEEAHNSVSTGGADVSIIENGGLSLAGKGGTRWRKVVMISLLVSDRGRGQCQCG